MSTKGKAQYAAITDPAILGTAERARLEREREQLEAMTADPGQPWATHANANSRLTEVRRLLSTDQRAQDAVVAEFRQRRASLPRSTQNSQAPVRRYAEIQHRNPDGTVELRRLPLPGGCSKGGSTVAALTAKAKALSLKADALAARLAKVQTQAANAGLVLNAPTTPAPQYLAPKPYWTN